MLWCTNMLTSVTVYDKKNKNNNNNNNNNSKSNKNNKKNKKNKNMKNKNKTKNNNNNNGNNIQKKKNNSNVDNACLTDWKLNNSITWNVGDIITIELNCKQWNVTFYGNNKLIQGKKLNFSN